MTDTVQRVPATAKSEKSTKTAARRPAINTRQLCFFAAFIAPLPKLLEAPSLLSKYALGDLLLPAFLQYLLQTLPLAALLFIASRTKTGLFSLIEKKLGKTGGKIIYCILAAYFLFSSLLPLLDLEKFTQAAFYDTAPSAFTFTPFFFLSGFICAKGLRSFGRIADICFPIFLISFFGLILMSFGESDYEAILPWFEFPPSKIFNAVKYTSAHFSDGILFLALLGDYRYQKGDGKKIVASFWAGGAFVLLFLATFYGIYTTTAPSQHYAFTKIAQYFPALKTVGRIDLLFVYLLTVVLLYAYTLPLQLCNNLIQKVTKWQNRAVLSAITNALLFLFVFFGNKYMNTFYELISQTLWWLFPIFSIAVPVAALFLLIGEKPPCPQSQKNSKEKNHAR